MLAYATPDPAQHWNLADKDKVHGPVFAFVNRIEIEQSDVYDRLLSLESLYDKHSPDGNLFDDPRTAQQLLNDMAENVVARQRRHDVRGDRDCRDPRARADRLRRLVDAAPRRHLELYAEGITKQLGLHPKCRLAFKGCAKKGGGIVKVWANRWRDVQAMHVPIDDIVVADADSRGDGPPRQLHHIMRDVDKDELAAEYPEFEDEIRNANRGGGSGKIGLPLRRREPASS
jgi:hypothetical protein